MKRIRKYYNGTALICTDVIKICREENMGRILVCLFVIWLIYKRRKEKNGTQSGQNQPVQPNQPVQQSRPVQPNRPPQQSRPVQPNRPPQQSRPPFPNQQMPQPNNGVTSDDYFKMQKLKAELQKKYGNQAKKAVDTAKKLAAYANKTECTLAHDHTNIVNRAADNVRENNTDVLREEMDEMRREDYGSGLAYTGGESALMREVEDLIVKGYTGELTYSRDFIAEGVELLNSFEVREFT